MRSFPVTVYVQNVRSLQSDAGESPLTLSCL